MKLPRDLAEALLDDLDALAAPEMEGRATGTRGAARARAYLTERFAEIGLRPVGGSFCHPFGEPEPGVNLLAAIPGEDVGAGWILVVAHHDHLGVLDGELFAGADDNASGVAALLAAATALAERGTRRTFLFLSPDAEERDQAGTRAWLADPPVPLERIELVVNLDMVSRSDRDELWVAGLAHFPELEPLVEAVAERAEVDVVAGHDEPDPDDDRYDWTTQSDHAAFHEAGLRWLYFGVEDHDDYHTPLDLPENIDPEFFVAATGVVADFLLLVDREELDSSTEEYP
jgi:Zn-dependent M28 family amino/carboxypeptidase